MIKINRMPTSMVLLVLSYIIALFGLVGGGYLIVIGFNKPRSLILALSVLCGGLLLAVTVRMFGNIGQILFELKNLIFDELKTLNQNTINSFDELKTLNQNTIDLSHQIQTQNQDLKSDLEHINCDSKDISQNMHEIKTFFEQIKRHLDLKK